VLRGFEVMRFPLFYAGGVSKEFFQLLVRAMFSPAYGMFEYNDETREYWFSPAALDMGVSKLDFRMVGIVLGCAPCSRVVTGRFT
jgi:ubiquitin-protein ligase E3 A